MPPKKNKQQKVSLLDFFAETPSSGSWADEIDNIPTAPAKKDPLAGPRRGEQGYLDSMPDRGARSDFSGPPRDEVPVPDVPPFTSFVGNLTFEATETDIREFFSALSPTSVRVVKDPATGKGKGFGYVEFGSKKDLQAALSKNMTNMAGRTIRVSVAEAPSNPRRDFGPSAAEEASQWRRSGPLPTREAPSMRARPSFAETSGDRERDRAPAPERDLDWGSARGAKFTPAPPSSEFRRGSSGAGVPRGERDNLRERDSQFSPGVADTADKWRSNKPPAAAAAAVESRPGPGPRAGSGQNSPGLAPGLADTESTWSRGSKLRTPADTPDASAAPSVAGEDSPKTPVQPTERKRLNLAPRSGSNASPSTPAPASGSSPSIFGAAKPIDTATREAEVEAKRVEERKKQQEEKARKQKEEDAKIQAESDARAKAINDAREAVRKEQGGAAASAGPGSTAGARKPTQAPRQNSNSNSNGNGPSRPNKGARTNSSQAQKTDDGFEVPKSRRDNRDRDHQSSTSTNSPAGGATAAAPTKKDAPIRQGFSFAAAAGLVDEATESKDEGEKTNGAGGEEDVTSRLAEVKV